MTENDLQASTFQQCMSLSTSMLGAIFPEEGKASECVFSGLYLVGTVELDKV